MSTISFDSKTELDALFLPQPSQPELIVLQFKVLFHLSVEVDLFVIEQIDVVSTHAGTITTDLEIQRSVWESKFQMVAC